MADEKDLSRLLSGKSKKIPLVETDSDYLDKRTVTKTVIAEKIQPTSKRYEFELLKHDEKPIEDDYYRPVKTIQTRGSFTSIQPNKIDQRAMEALLKDMQLNATRLGGYLKLDAHLSAPEFNGTYFSVNMVVYLKSPSEDKIALVDEQLVETVVKKKPKPRLPARKTKRKKDR
jgi:hypothetical protein